MKKALSSTLLAYILSILLLSCQKDASPSDPCWNTSIVITGTSVNSDGTNGSIDATATGSSGITYSKSGGAFQTSGTFTNLAPGTYTITAKDDKGCVSTKDFIIAPTKTFLITQSTWKFSTATVGGTNVNSLLQACQKDNIMTFLAVGTGTLDEGTTKCNAGDPQTVPFTWSLGSSETVLNISATLFTGGSSTFTLVSLSAMQLVLSQNITVGGTAQNAVVTFIH